MAVSTKPVLICVVGPTAIGKTQLAIALAQAFNTEIVSADSRQFFKEMNIGTAVPTKAELKQAPHHFIQNRSIFDPFTVGDFEKGALKVLHGIFKKATSAVLVGGSGLYVDAVVKGLDHFPKTGPGHRRDLNSIFEKKGMLPLQNELEQTDPEYFAIVDAHNKQRVIRALEVIRETGRPFSSFLKKETHARDFNTVFVGLQAPRQVVYQRINQRVDVMMKRGLLDEARRLYPHKNLNALKTVGYKELFGYFEGKTNLGAAVAEIKKNTRRYAKRQHTWFKKNKGILWFDHKTDALTIVKEVKNQEVF